MFSFVVAVFFPLSQIILVPDLIQVNCTPLTVSFAPTFVHFSPAFAAAKAGDAGISDRDRTIRPAISFLMVRAYSLINLCRVNRSAALSEFDR